MLPATAPLASNYTSSGPAGHEKTPQLVEENRQFVRQAIEGDEVY